MNTNHFDKKKLILLHLAEIQAEASDIADRSKRLEYRAKTLIRELEDLELYSNHGLQPGDSVEVMNDYQNQRGLQGFVYDISARFIHFVDFRNRTKHCREPQNIKRIAQPQSVPSFSPDFISSNPPDSHTSNNSFQFTFW